MNINAFVWVKLNASGRRALRGHFAKYTSDPETQIESLSDGDGYTKMSLWELMNVFGEYVYMAAEPVFEDNEVYLEKP